MIEILKNILGFVTGRTPEYEKLIKSFDEMRVIIHRMEEEQRAREMQWREERKRFLEKEEQDHLKILELERKVATLEITVAQLQSKLSNYEV